MTNYQSKFLILLLIICPSHCHINSNLFTRQAHLQLVKLCREANNTYGFHILLSIVTAFVIIINTIFNIYLCLIDEISPREKYEELARNGILFLYFWVKLAANSWLSTAVCRTVGTKMISYFQNKIDERKILSKLTMKYTHFSQWKVVIWFANFMMNLLLTKKQNPRFVYNLLWSIIRTTNQLNQLIYL